MIIKNFLSYPSVLFGAHFQSSRFFKYLLHLPPNVGCDPSQGYFQKNITRLKRVLQMIYFSIVNRLSKKAFPHLKYMCLGSVSLAFI